MSKPRLSKKIFRSQIFQNIVGHLAHNILRFIYASNKLEPNAKTQIAETEILSPVIVALWHGQHFLTPYFYSRENRKNIVTLVSKSEDARFNSVLLKLAGYGVVRGSGGRVREAAIEKGGISAFLELKRALADGKNVCMIADISKQTPRQAGNGILKLAELSGRPIVPMAVATSKFKVIEGAWDKSTINLPFGRSSVRFGKPIYVPAECSGEELDMLRSQLNEELNTITHQVYEAVGHDK